MIQEVGTVKKIRKASRHIELTCTASSELLQDYQIGDSMAINGVCLTAIEVTDSDFTVDIMPETFHKTTFSDVHVHAAVNLERAMPANGRLEGHIVSGHADITTRLIKKVKRRIPLFSRSIIHRKYKEKSWPKVRLRLMGQA